MWQRHWDLSEDPYAEGEGPFVPIPAHAEAVARLAQAIETGQRSATLQAWAGLGKSRVLAEALSLTRTPSRRVALVRGPSDGPSLMADLAERLGLRLTPGAGRAQAWRRLSDAVRLCHWQGLDIVLCIDDCHYLSDPAGRLDLERLVHLAPAPDARLTVVEVTRECECDFATGALSDWGMLIRLAPLTRTEAERYIATKLAAAGRDEPTFSPHALTRLHALAGGIPRGLDRLASLALLAGAAQRVEIITPEIVEASARECAAVAGEA